MAYVAVKDDEQVIEESLCRLKYEHVKKGVGVGVNQIERGVRLLVDQMVSEDSLCAPSFAALAIRQGEGSTEEAVSLLRSYRSTLPRRYHSHIIDSQEIEVERRVSVAFKNIPQGQLPGTDYDYVHHLPDSDLLQKRGEELKQYVKASLSEECTKGRTDLYLPRISGYLRRKGLLPPVENGNRVPRDTTKQMFSSSTQRGERLQALNREMMQAVTTLGYASLHGYGVVHPAVGELRVGQLLISISDPLQPGRGEDSYYIGEIEVTEVESLILITIADPNGEKELELKADYSITMGQNETKAIAINILDTCLESEDKGFAVNDEGFMLYYIDAVGVTGFISHLKLPRYVTFQSKLSSMRETKEEQADDEEEI